jgi:hypothetical protein
VTLYDVLKDRAIANNYIPAYDTECNYFRDIYPTIQSAVDSSFVNAAAAGGEFCDVLVEFCIASKKRKAKTCLAIGDKRPAWF